MAVLFRKYNHYRYYSHSHYYGKNNSCQKTLYWIARKTDKFSLAEQNAVSKQRVWVYYL